MLIFKFLFQLRENLIDFLIHGSAPIIAKIGKYEKLDVNFSQLMSLPDGTLGKETAVSLIEHQFEFIDHYESHDFKHVLLNYPMNGLGEVRLQFFALGNGNRFFPTFAITGLGMLVFPMSIFTFIKDFKRGKQAKDITYLDYENLVYFPLESLRNGLKSSD